MTTSESSFETFSTQTSAESKALPTDTVLVRVNGEIRVLWGLGSDLGVAWYSIDEETLIEIYGDGWNAYISEDIATEGSFTAKYGDYYWGAIEEVQLSSDDPWADLLDRAFDSFGYLAGFDDPEVKRIILQGYLEEWTEVEFLGNYQQTDFFNNLTNLQREWETLSTAEQEQRVGDMAVNLAITHRTLWGVDIDGGVANFGLRQEAAKIASGEITLAQWEFSQRRLAEAQSGTPAYATKLDLIAKGNAPQVEYENLIQFVEDQYKLWMGPVNPAKDFGNRWALGLRDGTFSDADLFSRLKEMSAARYLNKPEDTPWADWAAPVKGDIANLLELDSIEDSDGLLSNILQNGLTGQDATSAIRHDKRFLSTNTLYGELSNTISDLGRRMGFVS